MIRENHSNQVGVGSHMAFLRADTSKTMKSRTWSTDELAAGLTQILAANSLDLPDDLNQLQDHVFLREVWAMGGRSHVVRCMYSPHQCVLWLNYIIY